MKTIDQLRLLRGAVDPSTGILWAIAPDGSREEILRPGGVHPEYRNLVNAAPILFRVADEAQNGLAALVEWLEDIDANGAVHGILTLQGSLNVAVRCAVEGIEKIAGT
jgi:hypothetical protein